MFKQKPTPHAKLNFRLTDIIRAATGLAMIDGGFVIGIQVITFLLKYFGTNIEINGGDTGSIIGISRTTFLVAIIGVLNLAVIIYRITGLARGMKYSVAACYQHALRRWPVLILLFLAAGFLLLFTAAPIMRLLTMLNLPLDYNKVFLYIIMLFIPFGILTCIFVVDQNFNPVQAIIATFNTVRHKLSLNLFISIALLYSMPFALISYGINAKLIPYVDLINTLWFLFCHLLIIVIYAGTMISKNDGAEDKKTKVIIA